MPARPPAQHRIRARLPDVVLPASFFGLATIVFTWPIALRVSDGLIDVWDAKFVAWILKWDFHQLFHEPTRLFHANIFFPNPYVLAFSENLLGVSVFGFPLYAGGVSTLATYNILFLLGMFLSALAAWALARWMTGDASAALAAGFVYAFLPWRMSQIAHLQFQWGAFLALLLLFLLKFLRDGHSRDAILFGVFFVWNAASNVHYAIFAGILVAVVLVWELTTGGRERVRRTRAVLAVCAVSGVLLLPIFVPYWKASDYYGFQRSEGEVGFFSGRAVDFLRAGVANRLYGRLGERWPHAETEFFPGLLAIALAVFALLRAPRKPADGSPAKPVEISGWRRIGARICDALLILAAVAIPFSLTRGSMGPVRLHDPGRVVVIASVLLVLRLCLAFPRRSRFADLPDFLRRQRLPREVLLLLAILIVGALIALGTNTPYYRFLIQSAAFLFASIRAPGRGIVLFDLALAVLAAWGLSLATRRVRRARRKIAIAAALLLMIVEYRAFPWKIESIDPRPAPVYRWLASEQVPGAVMEWPFGTQFDFEYVFRSAEHWKPLVNGVSGFFPPIYVQLADALAKSPIPPDLWGKVPAGTSVVILHTRGVDTDSLVRFGGTAMDGVASGRLEPIAEFENAGGLDYVFRVTREADFTAGLSPQMRGRARGDFASLDLKHRAPPGAPFGVLDWPGDGEAVSARTWASGWALDDSGIAAVLVSLDRRAPVPAMVGLEHPGARKAHPNYPGSERAGFGFFIPPLPRGEHVLSVVFRARDGGSSELVRRIRIR